MAKIEISKTELVWPGKYDNAGAVIEVPKIKLPFQVIETINESRASRERTKKGKQVSLFDLYDGSEGDTFDKGWKNKLIWGDNLLVMGSLLEKFASKIDLIYIDPPFDVGEDFSMHVQLGEDDTIHKEQSILERVAFHDTWGKGIESYLTMMYTRLYQMYGLLSPTGCIYVHMDDHVGHYIKILLDNIFGLANFRNQIIWRRSAGHADAHRFGRNHDMIYFYSKSSSFSFNPQWGDSSEEDTARLYPLVDKDGRHYIIDNLAAKGAGPARRFGDQIITPPRGRHWAFSQENLDQLWAKGLIVITDSGTPRIIKYADETKRMPVQDIWADCIRHISTVTTFPTEKPEKLLTRIIEASSNANSLVADFFCGSGTTLAVAEKLGRRWIGCDLNRFAVHTTRKRLLDIEHSKPFEVLNLGKYERQYWQGVTFGDKTATERAIYEYLAFILKLYGAQPISGLMHIHGKKSRAMVHIGAIDAPVTIDEINLSIAETVHLKQTELHVLGWEWEMGLAGPNNEYHKGGPMHEIAKQQGVKLLLLQIPREAMEKQAVDKGDVHFFELAYLEVDKTISKSGKVTFKIKDFYIPNSELISDEIRQKITKWSDYIDYWAVDWDFQNDTFTQGWVTYRTRKDRSLVLETDEHKYDKPGKHTALIKVIDIFGNDTSQAFIVEVK